MDTSTSERFLLDIANRMMDKADLGASLQTMTTLLSGEIYAVRRALWVTNVLLTVIAAAVWFR